MSLTVGDRVYVLLRPHNRPTFGVIVRIEGDSIAVLLDGWGTPVDFKADRLHKETTA
jgi:hypothetical protein